MRDRPPFELIPRNLRFLFQQVRRAFRSGGPDQAVDLIEIAGDRAPARVIAAMTRQFDRLLGFPTNLR
jgi:hypothetical protein